MPGLRAGAGECARRRSNFLSLRRRVAGPKKVTKERATPSLRPLRFAKGHTCVGAVAGCAAELTALLSSSVQTAAASQMTKHGRTCAHATPQPPRRRRSHRGVDNQTPEHPNSHTGRRCTRPHLAGARATRCAGKAERSDGPKGCWLFGCPIPSVCAEERSGQRIRARGCLSAVKRSEFERDPAGREHRRLPEAQRRDADSGVAFSLVTFFRPAIRWRSKRKLLRRQAHSPAPALNTGMRPDQRTGPGFDKLSPNGWKASRKSLQIP